MRGHRSRFLGRQTSNSFATGEYRLVCSGRDDKGNPSVPIYDGVVSLNEDDVQVILGVDEDRIRLSAGGMEIGDWDIDDCSINDGGGGVFAITAENETLQFMPASPTMFAAAMNGGSISIPTPTSVAVEEDAPPLRAEPITATEEGPAPRPVTMLAFYALATVTAALGLWALISLFVG